MLTKIKESFLRAWRGEESLKNIIKKWGGGILLVLIISPILFIFSLMYCHAINSRFLATILFTIIIYTSLIYMYISLFLIHKNIKFQNIVLKLIKNIVFIILYLILLNVLYIFYS